MQRRSLAALAAPALALPFVLPVVRVAASSHGEAKTVSVKELDGTWRGRQTDRYGSGDVEWIIRNGEVVATVVHPSRTYTANGTLSAFGGRLYWNAPRSRGDVMLHESEGKRSLRYNLMGTVSGVPVVGEVHEVK